ncbi:MAG: helix-turn-helix domain-containing protein [Pseudomonadota bacterium]
MPSRYQDIFPSPPLLDSAEVLRPSAAALMSLRYFQAEPDTMPEEVYDEHHVLLNLRSRPTRVQNRRDGALRDFTLEPHDIIVTPAGVRSGWRWFETSDVIIITMDPTSVRRFAETELHLLLTDRQLADLPQFQDAEICTAGVLLRDTIEDDSVTSAVMFESLARVFLVRLLQKYGDTRDAPESDGGLTAARYARVMDHVAANFGGTIQVDDMARAAAMSASNFARVFRDTVGQTPMQYLMAYRIEQAIRAMADPGRGLGEIALTCGFADQAHFSRSFKAATGTTPRQYRASLS